MPPVSKEKCVDPTERPYALVRSNLVGAWFSYGLPDEILEFREQLGRNHADLVYQDPTQVQATIKQNAGVSFPTAAFARRVSLLISEGNVAPMVDGAAADVRRHRILYSQAYELVSVGPA